MANVYQPRMEIVNNGSAVEVWQEWGTFNSEEKAINVAREIQKEIDSGKYDNRKGCGILQMSVEVINEDNWCILEIIELKE